MIFWKLSKNSFVWFDVDINEIISIIKSFSLHKACGKDNIFIKILNKIKYHIAAIISELINPALHRVNYS